MDPHRTIASGKVEIGVFRTYTNQYAESKQKNNATVDQGSITSGEKFEDFGLHAHKYYKVPHSFFKSKLDNEIIERLWNDYWIATLSSSPLISN